MSIPIQSSGVLTGRQRWPSLDKASPSPNKHNMMPQVLEFTPGQNGNFSLNLNHTFLKHRYIGPNLYLKFSNEPEISEHRIAA